MNTRLASRRGMTLLEVMLVVAVLALLAGLTWPAALRYLKDHDLNRNVQIVRGELDRCRLKAIETGLIYQFRHEPNGQKFVILPEERPDLGSQIPGESTPTAAQPPSSIIPVVSGELGAEMGFGDVADGLRMAEPVVVEKLGEEWVNLFTDAHFNVGDVGWAPAIRFFPDGSSSGGDVMVHDSARRVVRLSVRDLTSAITVHPIERRERR